MRIKKLEDGDFLVHIDCDLRSLSERKMFVPVGKDGVPQRPEILPIVVKLARARKMVEMMAKGECDSRKDISDKYGMNRATVSRTISAAFLSPEIVSRVISGRIPIPKVQSLIEKLNVIPLWADHHRFLGIE